MGRFFMRTRVVPVVGLLVFGCAGVAWASALAAPPPQLIPLALRSVVQTRAEAAVAAPSDVERQLVPKAGLAVDIWPSPLAGPTLLAHLDRLADGPR
jgi:hypothetical protein